MTMVPTFIIILLFFASFLLTLWQYFHIDPKRRVLNFRFALMVCAIVGAIGYPIFDYCYPGDRHASWLLLTLAVLLMAIAYRLLRTMPPRQEY
jgi:predicted permease